MASSSRPAFASSLTPSKLAPGKGPPQPPPPPSGTATSSSGGITKKRTSHACDRCRLMRTKCSGGTRCTRCTKDDAVCVYGDHKRERNKKDLADSVTRVKELEDENMALVAALRRLTSMPGFQSTGHGEILNLLAQYPTDEAIDSTDDTLSQPQSLKSPITSTNLKSEEGGERNVPSTIGSPGHQGELRKVIHLDRGTGASGFIGKMSEISWMQRCREHLLNEPGNFATDIDLPELDQHAAAAEDLTYFTDDLNLLAVDEDHVDSSQWPPFPSAVINTEAFFHATEGAFEFLSREEFLAAMYDFSQNGAIPSWTQRRWLAVANLVWAIGSKWLRSAKLDGSEFPESHLVYYARARALGLDHRISFDRPDVMMIQGIGLLALYLLTNGSISRAWNTIGNAIRHAMSLGLHLKVSDPAISAREQSRRAKTWYSLFTLQTLIAEITGRPQLIRTSHVTIPSETLEEPQHDQSIVVDGVTGYEPSLLARQAWLNFLNSRTSPDVVMPGNIEELSKFPYLGLSVPRELFLYHIRLCQLSEEISEQLYTGCMEVPWAETQRKIQELQRALEAWAVTLPDELKLAGRGHVDGNPRAHIYLVMYSSSITMILHRSCLCEIHIEDESERSREFNLESARTCVRAAISMLDALPDNVAAHKVYQLLPWWIFLHYLCQAASVLLLELCLDARHFQGESGHVMTAMWKAMSYMACMTEGSKSAYRAWRIFYHLLQKVSVRYGDSNLFAMPQQAMQPTNWTDIEDNALQAALEFQWYGF